MQPGDAASRRHAGVSVDPAANTNGAQGGGGRMGMGEVVGKEFERIFGSLFRGGGGVRSSNDSDSSVASSPAPDIAPAIVAKELSKAKAGSGGREAGGHAAKGSARNEGKRRGGGGAGGGDSGRGVVPSSAGAPGDMSMKEGAAGSEQNAARSTAAFLQVCVVGGRGMHGRLGVCGETERRKRDLFATKETY